MRSLTSLFLLAISAFAAPQYLVLLKGGSALAWYENGKMIHSVPVGQHPHEMVFSPDRKLVYISDNGVLRIEHAGKGGNTISIVDLAQRRRIGVIPLGENYRPHGIALDPKTNRIVVTSEGPDGLLLVDPVGRRVVRRYETKGKTPHMVSLSPDGRTAYVCHSGEDTVGAVDLASGQVTLIKTGKRPEAGVFSKDGRELYVPNRDSNSITVIDVTKKQAIAHIPTGKGPVRIALTPDGKTLVYALMGEKKVAFADPALRKQTDYVLLPNSPVSLNLTDGGTIATASAEEQDTVYLVSLAEKKIVGTIRTEKGAGPDPVVSVPAR